jgi:hypothetical protein
MNEYPKHDTQFEDSTIKSVRQYEDGGGWSFTKSDGWSFGVPKDSPVVPTVGMSVRLYGKGVGYSVRGLFLDGNKVFYKTIAEQELKHQKWVEKYDNDKREDFEKNKSKMDQDYDSLPDNFKKRIDRFRDKDPNFRVDSESYEVFCCKEAIKIAEALKTPERIKEFRDATTWEAQKEMVPTIDDGHSGNTFGGACNLALWHVTDPECIR